MTAHPSDAELYFERLLAAVDDPHPRALLALPPHDLRLVLAVRLRYAMLMLALAVRLEGGK